MSENPGPKFKEGYCKHIVIDADEAEAMVVWIESATNGLLWAHEIEETDHEIMVLRKLARLLRETEPEPIF